MSWILSVIVLGIMAFVKLMDPIKRVPMPFYIGFLSLLIYRLEYLLYYHSIYLYVYQKKFSCLTKKLMLLASNLYYFIRTEELKKLVLRRIKEK